MQQIIIKLPEIKIIGRKIRTNNQQEMTKGKIGPLVQSYFQENCPSKIPDRTNPGRTLLVYTAYESDYTGDYDFYIGEEVNSLDNLKESFTRHIIPAQIFCKLTTEPGPMPEVSINAWKEIWQMEELGFDGYRRSYRSDFEVYDERAADPSNAILDFYISIKE